MTQVTRLLERAPSGDAEAAAELLSLVYDELRKVAAARLAREAPGQTLQATALVHEAWLRLGGDRQPNWQNRAHFFAAAAEAMRRILIDRARRRNVLKKGGYAFPEEVTESKIVVLAPPEELLAIDEALERLVSEDAMAADLVKLRYFAGMSMPEAAEALGISLRSAERLWRFARAWLRAELEKDQDSVR